MPPFRLSPGHRPWLSPDTADTRLVCIRARPLAVPQVAAPEALATVNFPGATGAKAQLSEQPYGTTKAVP